MRVTKEHGLYLAAQCCEHLNRAVVLERAAAEKIRLRAGLRGTVAAWRRIVCDGGILWIGGRCHRRACAGAAGIDIGDVLIGMQLKAVAFRSGYRRKRSEMRTLSARGQDRNTSAASGRITRKIRR